MQNNLSQIESITKKVQEHLQHMAVLQKEFENQRQMLHNLRNEKAVLEEKVRTLQEQNHLLKAATGDLPDAEKKQLETIINRYMKDIDKCIALLGE